MQPDPAGEPAAGIPTACHAARANGHRSGSRSQPMTCPSCASPMDLGSVRVDDATLGGRQRVLGTLAQLLAGGLPHHLLFRPASGSTPEVVSQWCANRSAYRCPRCQTVVILGAARRHLPST